jgi:hypothetical protein
MKKPQTTAGEGLVRQLERFLTALVNVRWEKGDEQAENDAQEIARMYRNYFPAGFVSVTPEDLTARNLQEKAIEDEFAAVGPELTVEDVRSERLQKIWVLTSMLRRVWKEQDLDAKDWHIFNARHFYNGTRNPEPPERNLFDQAMRHLQRHAARARFCSNPDCPSPY